MSLNKSSFEANSRISVTRGSSNISSVESNTVPYRANEQKLSPTPTNNPSDPLNWPLWLKIFILTQTSLLAAIGGLNTASINPALVKLGKEFGISTVRASYQTTVCIALNGIAPWLWIPLANKYGRRPVYLATTALGFGSALACAYTESYAQLLIARVFNGFFPVAFALGATTVTDLFFYHQRGRAMGFFTVTMCTGSHLAPIIGGLLGQYLGWRWIFKFAAIVDAFLLLVAFFCLPETLFPRPHLPQDSEEAINSTGNGITMVTTSTHHPPKLSFRTYLSRLRLVTYNPEANLQLSSFVVSTLKIAYYPSIIFPALYYATMYGFASILPAVTAAAIFTKHYHWNTLTIGLTYGTSLTIGGLLGECVSGWVLDLILKRSAQRLPLGKQPPPEVRLKAMWAGQILVPAGLLTYGFTLQYNTHWFAPIFGMGLACFGLQIITTTSYTYSIDCYRPQSAEVAQVFNFVRQEIGMTFAFYVVNLGEEIGFQWVFLMFTIFGGVLAFAPVLILMLYGEKVRKWFDEKTEKRTGTPK